MTDAPQPVLEASLCFVGSSAAGIRDASSALRLLGRAATEQGFAAPTYVDALLAREAAYPTGLPLPVPVAIPHADATHVRVPALAALVPPAPLTFGEMGSRDRTVQAELVLLLLVDDPGQQVGLLGRLITALQRPDLRERLLADLDTPAALAARFATLLES
ncbi:PTS sugar transporter subunit IIA [Nocardioides sp. cx-173]|uniref:PTS sugar transporter subunit IIA n=1 Tax=Nocardioides sp. cx-173 TaxID=2898796 RepID=UPI001E32E8D3|nr:PTS sugar transporter subunit IIA [Nocardioides sp. cx-173]MCD4526514.1 PTS sugar transporter subunit IIA [Nocardioides sp. cx-173]UGB41201.1 PTS sugar transporter subunit IIA [Nocardioides sp. cx-173]